MMLDDETSDIAPDGPLQPGQGGGPLRITVYKYPPPNASTDGGAGSDGADAQAAPWSPALGKLKITSCARPGPAPGFFASLSPIDTLRFSDRHGLPLPLPRLRGRVGEGA
jgi:hypothetical protein